MKKNLSMRISFLLLICCVIFWNPISVKAVEYPENGIMKTLNNASSVLVDDTGNIYAFAYWNRSISKYNKEGNLDTSWGENGTVQLPASFDTIIKMCFDKDGNIIGVSYNSNNVYRIGAIDGSTEWLASYSFRPVGCASDSDGNIYIGTMDKTIYKYNSNFQLLETYTLPVLGALFDLVVVPDGHIYCTMLNPHQIYCLNADFSIDTSFGENGVYTLDSSYGDMNITYNNNYLYVSAYNAYKITKIDLDGTIQKTLSTSERALDFFVNNEYYGIASLMDSYFRVFPTLQKDLIDNNVTTTLSSTKKFITSTDSIAIQITSDVTYGYEVSASVYDAETDTLVSDVTSSTTTLVDGDGTLTISAPADGWEEGMYYFVLNLSGNDYGFLSEGTYTLDQTLQIIKMEQTGFAFANSTKTVSVGDANFTVIASGGQSSGSITYTSSDTSVVRVDATSGEVTIVGIGTATITATKALDNNYLNATTTMTIIVKPKDIISIANSGINTLIVTGVDGTTFDPNTVFLVTDITANILESDLASHNANIQIINSSYQLLQLFDMKLLLGGNEIQPEGKILVSIPLTDTLKAYKGLQVVYVADDGTTQLLDSYIENDVLYFYTTHFSKYGVIGMSTNITTASPQTGEHTNPWILLSFIAVCGIGATGFQIIKENKKQSTL